MKSTIETHHYKSTISWLEISANGDAVTALSFCEKPSVQLQSGLPVIRQCCTELDEYFAGKRQDFEVKLAFKGTPFQEKVWKNLLKIPYGVTISYATLAEASGNPKAYRAAGSANGKNAIAIIIPCHRVINAGGKLGGYAYGLEAKKALLDLEQKSNKPDESR